MKCLLLVILAATCPLVSVAEPENMEMPAATDLPKPVPCEKEGKVIPKFVTKENYTFNGARLLAKYPDGLLFQVTTVAPPTLFPNSALQDCVVLVPADSLPEAVRKAVGGFNAGEVAAAHKVREEAGYPGNRDMYPKSIIGNFTVDIYGPANQDPFGDKTSDYGKAQTWEEYLASKAKRDQAAQEAENETAEAIAERKKAIDDPAGTEWVWGSGGKLELRDGGIARHTSWQKAGKWAKEANGQLILTNDDMSFTVTFNKKGIGRVVADNGKTTKLYFKRKKGTKG